MVHRSVLLLLAAGALAHAQLYFFEDNAPKLIQPKQTLTADVTATITARTPWGPFVQTEAGKYWRSSKGHIRQDDQHGISVVINLKERTQTTLDHESKLANQYRFPRLQRFDFDSTEIAFGGAVMKKAGKDVLDGYPVIIRKGQAGGISYETWSSDALKLVLLFRYTSETLVFEQRYVNIQRVEPDTKVFQIPENFKLHKFTF